MSETAPASLSTKTASPAPLLRASMPMAPVPAKRSRTLPDTLSPRMLKTASLTLSEVGLISRPLKEARRLPLQLPPTTLISQDQGKGRLRLLPCLLPRKPEHLYRYEPCPRAVELREIYGLPLAG